MNWGLLVTLLIAVLGPSLTAYFMRPKTRAETSKAEVETEKLRVEVTEKMLQLMQQAVERLQKKIDELTAELEKWKAELAAREAVFTEKERKLEAENAELRAMVRKGGEERRAILGAQDLIQAKFELQLTAFTSLEGEFRQLRAAVERMESSGPPTQDPIGDEGEREL